MNRFKTRLRRLCLCPMFPLFVLWTVIIVAHFIFPTSRADDAWFAKILEGDKLTFENWSRFLRERYQLWSSRIAIEGLLILMTRFPLLWRVIDTLVCISISILLARLSNPENNRTKNIVLSALWFVYPMHLTWTAGFIATTLNYTWPLAAALLAITPMVKQFQGRVVRPWEYAVALPALLFASFQELLCATILLAILGSLFYRVVFEKKLPVFQLVCLIICAAMLVFSLTCPGNDNRTLSETATWFPEYADFSLFLKVELGFSSMMKVMFLEPNFFVLVFCVALSLSVWLGGGRRLQKWISCIPAVFALLFGMLGGILGRVIPFVGSVHDWVGATGSGFSIAKPLTWLPILTFAALLLILLLSLYWSLEDIKEYCFLFFLLVVGAASRIAMGLSPTVWASGSRSCIFLYLAMAAVLGRVICKIICQIKAKVKQ